jgi:hypothetical protein
VAPGSGRVGMGMVRMGVTPPLATTIGCGEADAAAGSLRGGWLVVAVASPGKCRDIIPRERAGAGCLPWLFVGVLNKSLGERQGLPG